MRKLKSVQFIIAMSIIVQPLSIYAQTKSTPANGLPSVTRQVSATAASASAQAQAAAPAQAPASAAAEIIKPSTKQELPSLIPKEYRAGDGSIATDEFSKLIQSYMMAYAKANPPLVSIARILEQSIHNGKSFMQAVKQVEQDQKDVLAQENSGLSIKEQIEKSDSHFASSELSETTIKLLQYMAQSDDSEYRKNLKILGAIYIFDWPSQDAIHYLMNALKELFPKTYYRELAKDERPSHYVAQGIGGAVGIGLALSWALAKFRPDFFAKLGEKSPRAFNRPIFGSTKNTNSRYQRPSPRTSESPPPKPEAPKTSKSNAGENLNSNNKAENGGVKALTTAEAKNILGEFDKIEEELKAIESSFEELGLSHAHQQIAAQNEAKHLANTNAGRLLKTQQYFKNLESMQNKTLRAKSYRVLKTYIFDYFLNLDYKQQAAYLIGFGAIGVAGGTASYAWHSLQDPTKVTNKFAPLDPAEIDIISHEYMAMATLQYSCSLYDQKMLLSTQPTMTIAEVKSQVWQLEQVVKRQNFLNNNTYFQNKVFVPKNSISYNDGTNNVQLDLTVQNLHFVEKFKCDKYEGIGDQRLQVNLEETMLDAADVYLELLKRYQVLFAEDKSRGAKAK